MNAASADARSQLEIPAWANGPDGSANGGYAAGLLAEASGLGGAVEVSLRLPPPLDTPLRVEPLDGDGVELLLDGDAEPRLVATARRTDLADLHVPADAGAVDVAAARAASASFPYRDEHPFPRCLCCGIARDPAQPQLAIHCGAVPGTMLHADAWVPVANLADPADAQVASIPATWSALDCPSASPFADPNRPAVLARFEVELTGRARIGAPHVLVAWELGRDGRKLSSASLLLDDTGAVVGRARALWIEVRSA